MFANLLVLFVRLCLAVVLAIIIIMTLIAVINFTKEAFKRKKTARTTGNIKIRLVIEPISDEVALIEQEECATAPVNSLCKLCMLYGG